MNKWIKRGTLFLVLGCLALSATGCKGEQLMDKVLSKTDPKQEEDKKAADKTEEQDTPAVDVAKPELQTNLSGSFTYAVGTEADPLMIEAKASDGGVITYQWYKSQTNTNGGGTPVEGETKNTFTPPAEEAGTTYYYVVATSTIDTSTNGVTSDTVEIIVSDEAAAETPEQGAPAEEAQAAGWKESDNGSWWYDNGDGSFPKDQWKEIDGKWYAFDVDGYMQKGWYKDGEDWFYLKSDGTMAVDTDVEGYHIGSDGKME